MLRTVTKPGGTPYADRRDPVRRFAPLRLEIPRPGWYKVRPEVRPDRPGETPKYLILVKVTSMSRVCEVTGKRPAVGNRVSHANNKKRRRFLPNLHTQRFWVETEKRWVSLRISANGLRTIEKKGIDTVVAELRTQGVKI